MIDGSHPPWPSSRSDVSSVATSAHISKALASSHTGQWANLLPSSLLCGKSSSSERGFIHHTSLTAHDRHGARLDAADPQWHLTSPTPYDSPLTFGGWRQAQALGARIASIIQTREDTLDDPHAEGDSSDGNTHPPSPPRRRARPRHRVAIHSSPFLRCIQTSIAISAGLKQYEGRCDRAGPPQNAPPHPLHSGDPHARNGERWKSSHLSSIPEPDERAIRMRRNDSSHAREDTRTILRIDAFLGEWLSPDYFKDITPPPGSKMMVASAKADLLRRGEHIDAVNLPTAQALRQGNFPGGWRDSNIPTAAISENSVKDSPLSDLSGLKQTLPKLSRAYSHHIGDSPKLTGSKISRLPDSKSCANRSLIGYEPPNPSYAISPSQPIPAGYVAHARDACVNVDYQWDSLRPPLEWGDGGSFGEEWSAMHRRFRKGLGQVLLWYQTHGIFQEPSVEDESPPVSKVKTLPDRNGAEEEEPEVVLVLITHGAGCNALMGAISNHPVLIDVGMASLTMAVRKASRASSTSLPDEANSSLAQQRRPSSLEIGIHNEYDVKLTASTDHLRPGSRFLSYGRPSRSPSLPTRDKTPYRYERHIIPPHGVPHHHHHTHRRPTLTSSPLQENFDIAPDGTSVSADHDSLNRSATTSANPSPGLWSKPQSPQTPLQNSRDHVEGMHSGNSGNVTSGTLSVESLTIELASSAAPRDIAATNHGSANKNLKPLSTLMDDGNRSGVGTRNNSNRSVNGNSHSPTAQVFSPTGLWGPPPREEVRTEREKGPKRRWTLSEA